MPRSNATPRVVASARMASKARSSTPAGSTEARSRSKRWASRRARSSRSATRDSRRAASPSIADERPRDVVRPAPPRLTSAAAWPRIAVSGVRRSCVTRIRNSRVSPSRSASRRTIRLKSDASSSSSWVPVGPSSVRRSPPATRWVAACIAVSGRVIRLVSSSDSSSATPRPIPAAVKTREATSGHADASSPGGRVEQDGADRLVAQVDRRRRGLGAAASPGRRKSMRCTPSLLEHRRSRVSRAATEGISSVGCSAPGVRLEAGVVEPGVGPDQRLEVARAVRS